MKAASCPRLFEVEALRDERLTGIERTSFERHLAVCAECSHYAQELAALQRALLASYPAPADELRARRERTRLLAAFDRAQLTPESRRLSPKRAAVAAVMAVLAAALGESFVRWRTQPGSESVYTGSARTSDSVAVVRADGAALWSRRTPTSGEQIVLEHGALWIQVRHAQRKTPFLVVLPDGELEDTGTTFSVAVEAGKTTRVAVEDGSVVLRLRGRAPVHVKAGETWVADRQLPSPAPAPPVRVEQAPLDGVVPHPPAPHHSRRPRKVDSSLTHDVADEFRAAVAALGRGDDYDAATRFARFVERHPDDPRAEDAAYLRVLAFQHSANDAAMKTAAFDYLRRFPSGFRRREVEALAR